MSLRITRRRFALYGAAALTTAVAIDGFGLEPYHPVAKPMEIQLARLPESFDGFRIAQISDIHFGPYIGRDNVARAVRLVLGGRVRAARDHHLHLVEDVTVDDRRLNDLV